MQVTDSASTGTAPQLHPVAQLLGGCVTESKPSGTRPLNQLSLPELRRIQPRRILGGVILASLLLVVAGREALAQAVAAPVDVAVTGQLTEQEGIRILSLHGTDRERGFAEGYLLAPELHSMFLDFALKRAVPNPNVWELVIRRQLRKRVGFPEWAQQRYLGLVEGVRARGAKWLHVEELDRDLDELDFMALSTLPDFAGLACSSFAAWGERTEGGGLVVGRNLDYMASAQMLKHTMVIVHAPIGNRRGWVGIGWPGMVGLLTGVSDQGVWAAIHDVDSKARGRERITPRVIALQELIENTTPGEDPVADGLALLRGHRYGMGGNVMFGWSADAHGKPGACVFEIDGEADEAGGVSARLPSDDATFLVCSNHHRTRQDAEDCWRYTALVDAVATATDLDGAKGELAIHKSEVDGTLYQAVIDFSEGRLAVRMRRASHGDRWSRAAEIDFATLLRSAVQEPPAVNHPERKQPAK